MINKADELFPIANIVNRDPLWLTSWADWLSSHLSMSRIYSAVSVDTRMADALFREVPEDDEEDEEEQGEDVDEGEDEGAGYSE